MDHQWKVVVQDMMALDPNASRGRQDRIAEELGSLVDLQQEAASDRRREKMRINSQVRYLGGKWKFLCDCVGLDERRIYQGYGGT